MKKVLVVVFVLVFAAALFAAQDGKEKKNTPNGQGIGLIKNGTIEPTPTPTPTSDGGRTTAANDVWEIIE